MDEEKFIYRERVVVVQPVQPLVGGWIWRISIDGKMQPPPRRNAIKYKEDAITFGVMEAKAIIDLNEKLQSSE